ncbi:hypothetical protein Hanom_Chr09g00762361 [Helianthus anomalus]
MWGKISRYLFKFISMFVYMIDIIKFNFLLAVIIKVMLTSFDDCYFLYPCFFIFFFFEQQIWITDGPLKYYRATSGTTRSYPSPLGIMSHQFRRKPNKYGKTPFWESNS